MDDRNWSQIKELFAQAIEQPVAVRQSFLAETCRGDLQLQKEIQSLLAAHDETENLVEQNALPLASAFQTERSYADRTFGNYKIIREIGRGGMGAVYLAERSDGEFDQHVALKIVRQTLLDPRIEARFRQERQILASLNHPNIARLLDGGISSNDEPYLAMEFIDGAPIIDAAQEQGLTLEEKLNLFLKVCVAVSFAHRNLIIHRDLKPSNILVNREGEPKLLDFGLAEFLNENIPDSAPTKTYFRAFTPAYASPEQIQGRRVATTTDVYSLGVVLYELLTGTRPYQFENKSYEEIIRSVETLNEPPSPSSVVSLQKRVDDTDYRHAARTAEFLEKDYSVKINSKRLAGDLDNIVLKALRREPERRYDSVESFALDIKRHLHNLPISARPDAFSYRASKFWLRNKIGVTAAFLVFLALVAGLTIALWQAQVARRQTLRAEKRFQDVRALSNSLLSDIEPKIENLSGATAARQSIVEQSLKYLDSLATETGNDLELQTELAAAYEKVGDVQGNPQKSNLNDFAGARTSYEKAINIRQSLIEKNPLNFENRVSLAADYRNLAVLEYWIGDADASVRYSDEALNLYSRLIDENPQATDLKIAFAAASFERANFLFINNRLTESYPYLDKPLQMLEKLNSENPFDAETERMLAKGYRQLGATLSWDLKQPAAESNMNRAIALNEKLTAANPNNILFARDLLQTYADASSIYEEIDNPRSLEFAEKALQMAQSLVHKDSADTQAKINLASAYLRAATIFEQLKNFQKEKEYLTNSLQTFSSLEKEDLRNQTYQTLIGTVYMHFGTAKVNLADNAGAIEDLNNAARIFHSVVDQNGESKGELRHLAMVYSNLGEAYEKLGNPAEAKQNYRRSLDFYNQLQKINSLTEYDRQYLEKLQKKIQ